VASVYIFQSFSLPDTPFQIWLLPLTAELKDLGFILTTRVAVSPKAAWFAKAITDPATLSAALVLSAAHYAALQGHMSIEFLTKQKNEAISFINARLGDPVLSVSDGTIGAVSCLALCEVRMLAPILGE
jgi:hypothetical protein